MSDPVVKIGKYEIQGELGSGGMGIVYKGWDPAINREVAIKGVRKYSLPEDERESVLTRFRQEAQAVGRLVHPRIVQIYDFIEDENAAYIIMELVHGKTLSQHLAAMEVFGLREIAQIITQTLDGIGYAHAQGVVHRDMKSANVMINNDGRIKINDFGIARIDTSTLTKVGDLIGTPSYMSPEQFTGAEVDKSSDLYSIGVIAYELLTGRKPFTGTLPVIMQQVVNATPVKPSLINHKLSPEVDQVIAKAMAKNPADRYRTASEFADAFKAAIHASLMLGEPQPAVGMPDAARLMDAARGLKVDSASRNATAAEEEMYGDSPIILNPGIRKARLLIVDDEERILNALKSLFRQRYHVFTTTDGNKALDFITRYQMHVIISDQRMPIMTGVELLRRSREISPHSVRILLTGYSDLAAMVGSINDGEVYRFLNKPWDNQALQTLVGEAATIALELADTKSTNVVLPEKMQAGVLVVDRDEEVYGVVRELVGSLCPVLYAANTDAALAILQKYEIALVIADVESSQEKLTSMLKLLKQEYPKILSIVVTKAKDAELVIELINQAQVFRILNKPINVGTMKSHVHAALHRYLTYVQFPQLLQAQKVEAPVQVRKSSAAVSILRSLGLLRGA
ncbi:MAG: protein kinase [Gammaproteobacteria bacterium]|nr:protein kinase [Gammaproteobacteria bacterium]MBU1481831.1 protein kinase [Gammaproteobacteria bacterium]